MQITPKFNFDNLLDNKLLGWIRLFPNKKNKVVFKNKLNSKISFEIYGNREDANTESEKGYNFSVNIEDIMDQVIELQINAVNYMIYVPNADLLLEIKYNNLKFSDNFLPKMSFKQLMFSKFFVFLTKYKICLIVPSFKNFEEISNCLLSLKEAEKISNINYETQIIVSSDYINSSHEKKLSKLCKELDFTFFQNKSNIGFLKNVNQHFSKNSDFFGFLNTDTILDKNSLKNMLDTFSNDTIGSVTAISNEQDIFSFARDLIVPDEWLNYVKNLSFSRDHYYLPTMIGHFAIIRISSIHRSFLFNEIFNLGYGEENELSIYISRNGFRHVMNVNAFCFHYGGTSFSEKKSDYIQENLISLNKIYPFYNILIKTFKETTKYFDDIFILDFDRLSKELSKTITIIYDQKLGGGTNSYTQTHAENTLKNNYLILMDNGKIIECISTKIKFLISYNSLKKLKLLISTFNELKVFHVNHFVKSNLDPLKLLSEKQNISVKKIFFAHDYSLICPRADLVGGNGEFSDGPNDFEKCDICIKNFGTNVANNIKFENIQLYLKRNQQFVNRFDYIYAPTKQTLNTISRYLNLNEISKVVRNHVDNSNLKRRYLRDKKTMNIGLFGDIGLSKGSAKLITFINHSFYKYQNINWKLFGSISEVNKIANLPNFYNYGRYNQSNIYKFVKNANLNIALFCSIWGETFCYAVNVPIKFGIPCLVPNSGAFKERFTGKKGVSFYDVNANLNQIFEIIIKNFKSNDIPKLDQEKYTIEDYYDI